MTDQNEMHDVELEEGSLAADSLKPASKSVDDPKSKVEYITAMIGAMHTMKKDDLVSWYNQTMAQFGPNKDYGVGDNSASNAATLKMKPSAATVKEDIEEMFAGYDLTEDFKERAETLFEAAVNARIALETVALEEAYEEALTEAVEEIHEELTTKLDTYLEYVIENWMEENEVAIESTLRNELMDEFMDGLKNLFAEHYINVPEDKVEVVESLAERVEQLESMLNETINENVEMRKAFVEVEKKDIVESLSDDLALSQQEKFKALAEGIDFDGDLETYAKKLSIVKENYFGEKKSASSTYIEEETFEGEVGAEVVSVDPVVNKYVQAISRTIKK